MTPSHWRERASSPGSGIHDHVLDLAHDVVGLFGYDGAVHSLSPHWHGLEGLERLHELTDVDQHPRIDECLAAVWANGEAATIAPFRGGAITYAWRLQAVDTTSLYLALTPVDPSPALAHAGLAGDHAGIALTDADGYLYYLNQALANKYGYSRDALIGQPFITLLGGRDQAAALECHRAIIEGELTAQELEFVIERGDGALRNVCVYTGRVTLPEGVFRMSTVIDITEIRTSERQLADAEARYRLLFENSSEGIYWSSPEGRLLQVNWPLVRMHRCQSKEELIEGVRDLAEDWYVEPTDRDRFAELLERDGHVEEFEAAVYRCGEGSVFWTSENASVVRGGDGGVLYYQGTVRDITEERRRRELATQRTAILEQVARDEDLSLILHEIVGAIEQYHPRITAAVCRLQAGLLHVAAAPGLAKSCIDAIHRRSPDDIGDPLATVLHTREPVMDTDLVIDDRRQGTLAAAVDDAVYSNVMALPVRNQADVTLGILAVFFARRSDATDTLVQTLREMTQIASLAFERQSMTEQLRQQAQYDPLTGLPNRTLFDDRLGHLMLDAGRSDYAIAVMMLDLDEFKLVNDTLGHSTGDRLLQEVGQRLSEHVRGGDTVARFGGDEFVLLAPLDSKVRAKDVAERLLEELQPPVHIKGQQLHVRPSIGISLFPQDGLSAESLIRAADTAMYAAKNAGKNQFRFFSESMNEQVTHRVRIEGELRRALDNDELVLHYQPVLTCDEERVVGAEALLRWQHPDRGLLVPGDFLPVAELSDLIAQIDHYVLDKAMRQVGQWRREGHELLMSLIVTSLNLSARGLHEEGFAMEVARILDEVGIPSSSIELEITESMVMRDFDAAVSQLRELRARAPGLRIAIDDFGTGQSSFEYLRQLPVDTLKIDYSFIADITGSEVDRTAKAIVKTIVELGHNLGLTVVGEGVETRAQADFLRSVGCHRLQGFLYSSALERSAFEAYVGG